MILDHVGDLSIGERLDAFAGLGIPYLDMSVIGS